MCYGNGKLYSSEHGTGANDEINIIMQNRNYGWPTVEGLCNTPAEITFCNANNVVEPIWSWSPSIAPCGLDLYQNTAIPEWNNSLLLAVLKNKQLIQLKLSADGSTITQQNIYLTNTYGRLRDVLVIPDGRVFICTSNKDYAGTPGATDDRIIELKNQALGTVDYQEDTSTTVYPVPSNHMVYIDSKAAFHSIRIISNDGKEVYSSTATDKVDVSFLAGGIYYLQLLDSDKIVETKKIIIR